jgi:hypothetical protein
MSGLRQADAVGQHLAAKEPLPTLSERYLNRSRCLSSGAGYGEQHLCFVMPAADGSESLYRATIVQPPKRILTGVCADDFVRRKRPCGNQNQPQMATTAGNHSCNGLLETSNGKRVS